MQSFEVAKPSIVVIETAFYGHIDSMGDVRWRVIYDLFHMPWKEHTHVGVPYQTELLYDNVLI